MKYVRDLLKPRAYVGQADADVRAVFYYLDVPKRRVGSDDIAANLNLPLDVVNAALESLHAAGQITRLRVQGRDGVWRVMWRV